MKKLMIAGLLSLLPLPSAAADPSDPLDGLPGDALSLELKEVHAADVFSLLGGLAKTDFEVDACVKGTLTMKLQDVTVASVLDTIADALWLRYERVGHGIAVRCDASAGQHARVDLQLVRASLSDVLSSLADASGLKLTSSGCDDLHIDLNVQNAPPRAVLRELASQAGAQIEAGPGRMHVRCEPKR